MGTLVQVLALDVMLPIEIKHAQKTNDIKRVRVATTLNMQLYSELLLIKRKFLTMS